MAYSLTLSPTPAAGKGIPFSWFTQLLENTNAIFQMDFASYTPTWTNGTLGDGTLTGKYWQLGKLVIFHIVLVWGTTTSSAGSWAFSLPVTAAALVGTEPICGVGEAVNTGVAAYFLRARLTSTAAVAVMTGEGAAVAKVATAAPFAWGSTDELSILGAYEAA